MGEFTGSDALGHVGRADIGDRHVVSETVRIEKPEMVIYNGRIYYDVTPYFNMDSSKTVLQRVPENTPERQKELRRREREKYRMTRTWTAE